MRGKFRVHEPCASNGVLDTRAVTPLAARFVLGTVVATADGRVYFLL